MFKIRFFFFCNFIKMSTTVVVKRSRRSLFQSNRRLTFRSSFFLAVSVCALTWCETKERRRSVGIWSCVSVFVLLTNASTKYACRLCDSSRYICSRPAPKHTCFNCTDNSFAKKKTVIQRRAQQKSK